MTGAELASLARPVQLLPAGPSQAESVAEASRPLGGLHLGAPGRPAIEYFTGTRVDLTFDEALGRVRSFTPDLNSDETFDFVGQMVATALRIPWAEHSSSRTRGLQGLALLARNACRNIRQRPVSRSDSAVNDQSDSAADGSLRSTGSRPPRQPRLPRPSVDLSTPASACITSAAGASRPAALAANSRIRRYTTARTKSSGGCSPSPTTSIRGFSDSTRCR